MSIHDKYNTKAAALYRDKVNSVAGFSEREENY